MSRILCILFLLLNISPLCAMSLEERLANNQAMLNAKIARLARIHVQKNALYEELAKQKYILDVYHLLRGALPQDFYEKMSKNQCTIYNLEVMAVGLQQEIPIWRKKCGLLEFQIMKEKENKKMDLKSKQNERLKVALANSTHW